MPHSDISHSELLERHLLQLKVACQNNEGMPILDLACGQGRNGLFLSRNGLPVMYADRNDAALAQVHSTLVNHSLPVQSLSQPQGATLWPVDFEIPDIDRQHPLLGKVFSSVLVFRYLHRPIMPLILDAVAVGGLLIYETFTVNNRQYGRPNNPDFLLNPNELLEWLLKDVKADWHVLHHYEGFCADPDRDIAQVVAQKRSKA